MEVRSLKFIATACGGELLCGSPEVTVCRICTDSRQARLGDVFFALTGEHFDGHDYLAEVAKQGVEAVVVDKALAPAGLYGCGVIAVENTRAALGRLAACYRMDFNLPTIAVAGSNGKTTTKELLAAVLRQKFKTLWSEASFNNNVGVPLTLLRLDKGHQAAVLEAGTNHPGELAPLVRMIRPRFGVITNIGREHLEFFGDLAGVAGEEGWLAELLPVDGKLFLNGDSEWTGVLSERTNSEVVTVGLSAGNDWRAQEIKMTAQGVTFQVQAPRTEFSGEYHIRLLGRHQVVNALLAAAAGAELGLTPGEIRRGLAECCPAKMRLETRIWNGVCVLDDSYNANADSMIAALNTLREMPCAGRRVAVLGDMAELGKSSAAAHEEIGRRAGEMNVDQLFAVGRMAGMMARAARAAGLQHVTEFANAPAAAEAVKGFLKSGDVVLLKASRSSRLELVGELLRSEPQSGNN